MYSRPLSRPVRLTLIAAALGCALAAAPSQARAARAVERAKSVAVAPVEKKWGIKPVSVRPAAGGYLVYFRYKVTDASKAGLLFDPKVKPYLVDHKTGAKLAMPQDTKLGALRSSPRTAPVDGKEYFVLFSNSLGKLHRGSKVDVILGDCKMENLVVD